jgi:large repetitive protein
VVNNASDPNDDKITYQFELYSDSGLTKFEATSGQLPEGTNITTWTVPFTLTENQTYYWRARAFDGWLYGPWTSTASFRVNTVNEPPTAPVLLSPADNGIVSTLTPTLTSTNATDPDSINLTYNYDVALDPDFTQIVISGTGVAGGQGTTSWQVSIPLTENMTYYWRAQADDWLITGPWSATSRFFVNTVNTAPSAPVILAPLNNATVTSLTTDITVQNSIDPDSMNITYFFEADVVPSFDSSSAIRSGAVTQGQGSTTWTLSGLKDNTHYYLRVKAGDGQADSPWSGVMTFFANTANDPPTAPAIANPSNGAGVNTTTPTLSVQNAVDPDGDTLTYEFALYADSGMTSLIASAQAIPEISGATSWSVPSALIENQNYYWRARAFDGKIYGNWSVLATFMVNAANLGPGAPTILLPLDNSSVGTLNPVLTIGNALNPSHARLTYEFEVYKDGTLINAIANVPENSTGITSITLTTSLLDNTVYQWKARAFDGDRYGPWSPLATFTVHLPHTSITVDIEFEPETLNKQSHGTWVTVKIELPHGYKAKEIDISSVRLEGTVHAERWPCEYHYHDHEHGCDHDHHSHHHEVLMVKFKRSEVIAVVPEGKHVPVHVTGLINTTPFEGVDVIRVTNDSHDCGGH